ncbi:hypothetical protein BO94DRAFT_587417 [Aspergillus sclerotioniger CBS 115572]|uniref:Cytochrome P450 n=1 Tax=Aspergillus sclerotioniger CBS 115572 TaxID=1450535 RepID=A0A317W574_9EURO|nr:hypothetical protein BO94DRAFT_587417 [Aspergillus sclerotioniger CBS 115572]PWY81714.1 hypothetical protein BO94DRAFT_587417 [Aspergillus sclerotioniger CBS 115572]
MADNPTVAQSLVFLFYNLILHPAKAEYMYREDYGMDCAQPLQQLPFLNAVTKEKLRLDRAVLAFGYGYI